MNRNIFNLIRHKFRTMLRPYVKPIPIDEAEEKREFFAKLYMVSAIAAFVWLMIVVGVKKIDFNLDSNLSRPAQLAQLHGYKEIRYIKFDGFKKVEDFVYKKGEEEEETKPVESKPEENALEEDLTENVQEYQEEKFFK